MVDDAELLRRYAEEKSEAAFTELVQRHLDLVYSAALRRLAGDAHAAADITQQVFTALARQADSLTRCAVLPGWLYATTRNVAVDFIRVEKRRRTREQEAHTMQQLNAASVSPEWENLRPTLDAAMDELSTADREAVLLRFFSRRSFGEIGVALKVSEDAARMRVERALEKLRTLLARRGVTSTATALSAALSSEAVVAAPAELARSVAGSALTAAGGGLAPALSLFELMSTTKFIGTAAVMLAVLAIGTAGYCVKARDRAEASLLSAHQEQGQRLARLRELEGRSRLAAEESAGLRQQVEAARAAEAAAKNWDPVAEGKAFLQRHPEVEVAIRRRAMALANTNLWKFFQAHQFDATQIAKLQIAAAETKNDLTLEVGDRKIQLSVTMEHDGGTRALLGEELYPEFLHYVSDSLGYRPAMMATVRLSSDLWTTDAPLASPQAEAMVEMLRVEFRGEFRKPRQWTSIDWSGIDAKARDILAPAQLPAWEQALERTKLTMAQDRSRGYFPSTPAAK
ncbi:MAG: sigma-70 family RNA polymerase sigma factor [Verrucomicrobia bacterium]|nr:sigma-70 family RNA polymerase sigma factor [Verrucomicrobiota bacterium]